MPIGFDPGRDKCGVAIANGEGEILLREIMPSDQVEDLLPGRCKEHGLDMFSAGMLLVMGNQTTSKQWRERLCGAFPNLDIQLVDERYSSQEARQRYWEIYPPKGLQWFIPKGMRVPPRPVDDIVAEILLERFAAKQEHD